MLKSLLVLCGIASAWGAGEFSVVHHPGSIIFRGHEAIKETALPEVFTAALGFSTEHFSNWRGFYIDNPFNIPEAVVTIAVDGVRDAGQTKGHHYPLITNVDEGQVFKSLAKRIVERFPDEGPTLVRVDLANGLEDVKKYYVFDGIDNKESPEEVKHKQLKLDIEEDRAFLRDMALLTNVAKRIGEGVAKEDSVPDVFWFRVASLHPLSDLHGANSSETKEARQLLENVISLLTDAFVKRYDNRVFVSVMTSDASHTRQRRNLMATEESEEKESNKSKYNLASTYTKEYPAIFNIILWFSVVMFFALLAICYATANMDPGRDSIIYRMTSTRMKKDN
ncbi:ATPase H(+)-transporting accessory protein 2 [Anthonomus grandis grandis]|uniref:ATPase H(+)-transporting accessory protein 2 n=1 Tax=Anthonomus grandis grandis TaxID=2921223 RepID=UPI0021656E7D|nr:ATPase H(+)-transporting accessory protein 2 [Anthonomus grandis grandis]